VLGVLQQQGHHAVSLRSAAEAVLFESLPDLLRVHED
jgi:hypothetical protein